MRGRHARTLGSILALALLTGLAASPAAPADRAPREKDFKCLTKGKKVPGKHFYVFHRNKKLLRKAVKIARKGEQGLDFPVGTILQLFPFEAMAKRAKGFNPDGGDWEYFQLVPSTEGTTIKARGAAEVANFVGSCQGCHTAVAKQFDFVCEYVTGASGLGLTDAQIEAAQAADPRCAPKR